MAVTRLLEALGPPVLILIELFEPFEALPDRLAARLGESTVAFAVDERVHEREELVDVRAQLLGVVDGDRMRNLRETKTD